MFFSISGFKSSAKEYQRIGVGCQGTCGVKQSIVVPCGIAAPLARAGAEEEDKLLSSNAILVLTEMKSY